MFQGKSKALRVLTPPRDDLPDTTSPSLSGPIEQRPYLLLKADICSLSFLSFGVSYNKGIGNIDKMGNCVKKKSGGTKKKFLRAKKLSNLMVLQAYHAKVFCQACLSELISALTTFWPRRSFITKFLVSVTFAIWPNGRFNISLAKEL